MASISHSRTAFTGTSASDLLRSSSKGMSGIPLKTLGKPFFALKRRDVAVAAKLRLTKKRENPWPADPDGNWTHVTDFKPLKEKPKPVILEFEKPLVRMEKQIVDMKTMANETGLDFTEQLSLLENKYHKALRDLYTHLTPIQRVYIARHPNRPTFLDHILNITEKFVELHGDRAGYDDPAIVAGIGTLDNRNYMFIGNQKGRESKENMKRNFGMPTPHGYRKALRMMRYADHHGFPIVTFVDTPGAFADLKSEELGQGEAIAQNLRSMFGLKVPIISIVIGEGGSGGALGIACGNKLLMLENAVFYVASPEAAAAILFKDSKASPMAAEKLKLTARELKKLRICDGIIREPLGGAHTDPAWTSQQIKAAINKSMDELAAMDTNELLKQRMRKFRNIGLFREGVPVDPKNKFNMKKKDQRIANAELQGEIEKLKQQILKAKESSTEPPKVAMKDIIEKLKKEVDHEYSEAIKATGLKDILEQLKEGVSIINSSGQLVDPVMMDKIEKCKDKIDQRLSAAPNYTTFKNKLDMLEQVSKAKSLSQAQEIYKKFKEPSEVAVKAIIEKLKKEVDHEYSKAIKATGLKDILKQLKEGVSIINSMGHQLVDPVVMAKIEKSKDKIDQRLSAAPNYTTFKNKLKVLKEVSKSTVQQEIDKKFEEVTNRPEIKKKLEAIKAEVQDSGSSSLADLDQELKDKILNMNKEIELEVGNALKSSALEVEVVKSDFKNKVNNLNEEINKKIEDVANSPELKTMIESWELEIEKAGNNPDIESKSKIEALEQQIKQRLAEAISSSELKGKHEELVAELNGKQRLSEALESPAGMDGSPKKETKYEEPSLEIKLGLNRSFA